MKKRSASVELFRCLLMYGICLFHSLGQGPYNIPMLSNLLKCCVIGFVLISGFYGVRFSWYKLAKLYGVAFLAILLSNVAYCLLNFSPSDFNGALARFNRDFRACWFLHAYAGLMMITPIINAAFDWACEDLTLKRAWLVFGPFLLFVFGWGFVLAIPHLGDLVPRPAGLGTHTVLTLCGCYVVGRLYRLFDCDQFINGRKMFLILPLLTVICAVGFSSYDSPFSLLLAAIGFKYVKGLHVPDSAASILLWLGSAMFTVYCFHTGMFGQALIPFVEQRIGNGFGVFAAASLLFVGGIVSYLPFYLLFRVGLILARSSK